MPARDILERLFEAEPLDSLEGVPEWNPENVYKPGTLEYRADQLRWHRPGGVADAKRLGVNWYIKNGRKFTFSSAEPEAPNYPRNSNTMATNRNARLRSFGMGDRVKSTAERNWPTPSRSGYYKKLDREREERHGAFPGAGI